MSDDDGWRQTSWGGIWYRGQYFKGHREPWSFGDYVVAMVLLLLVFLSIWSQL
jgi:hypothetical protein